MFSVATKHTKQRIEEAALVTNPYNYVEIDSIFVDDMYEAIIKNDKKAEQKLWLKSINKSLKHKRTYVIK